MKGLVVSFSHTGHCLDHRPCFFLYRIFVFASHFQTNLGKMKVLLTMNEMANVILMSRFTRIKERAGWWIALLERREEGSFVRYYICCKNTLAVRSKVEEESGWSILPLHPPYFLLWSETCHSAQKSKIQFWFDCNRGTVYFLREAQWHTLYSTSYHALGSVLVLFSK